MKEEKILKYIDIFILILALICLFILIFTYVLNIVFPTATMMFFLLISYIVASGGKQMIVGNRKTGQYLIGFSIFMIALYALYQMVYYKLS